MTKSAVCGHCWSIDASASVQCWYWSYR